MNSTITQDPARVINSEGTFPNIQYFVSRWSAAHNPIIYKIRRKDYQIALITETLTPFATHKIKLTSAIIAPDTITFGDTIYFKSGNYDTLARVATVISSTEFYVANLVGSPALANKGSSIGGWINLNTVRENFHFDVEILGVNYSTNQYEVLGTATIYPDAKGIAQINIQEWIKKNIVYENTFDYSSLNKKDSNHSGSFNFRFIEQWLDNSDNAISGGTILNSQRNYYINSARQL